MMERFLKHQLSQLIPWVEEIEVQRIQEPVPRLTGPGWGCANWEWNISWAQKTKQHTHHSHWLQLVLLACHGNRGNLPRATLLMKNDWSPSSCSHQLWTAPQLGVTTVSPSLMSQSLNVWDSAENLLGIWNYLEIWIWGVCVCVRACFTLHVPRTCAEMTQRSNSMRSVDRDKHAPVAFPHELGFPVEVSCWSWEIAFQERKCVETSLPGTAASLILEVILQQWF